MTVSEKVAALRGCMKEEGIDLCLVPTDDFHGSEYVGDYFRCREWLTGFDGSAGTAVVTQEEALLWTDGRYFLQAASQLEGSGFTLMKIGEEGVPTIAEYVIRTLKTGGVLGFDGRCVSAYEGESFEEELAKKGASVKADTDLIDRIWTDRPKLSCRPVWELPLEYAGKTRAEKLADLRGAMKKAECSVHVLTSLDDIAWLLNLRGDDVACNPVFLSCLVVTAERVRLFVQAKAVSRELALRLAEDGISIEPYHAVYDFVWTIGDEVRVLMDKKHVNYRMWKAVGARKVDRTNPTLPAKAVKNPTEMECIRKAHIKDGLAVTRFMYWLKKRMEHYDPADGETELSASAKLEGFRKEQEHYLGPSFDTISGYGPHGAIMHYEPTEETDAALKAEGFLLVDSGGQYLEGTTDITRTFALGALTRKEKEIYTRVLRGTLALAAAKFKSGCTGMAFDYLARRPLWEAGLDYNHGTGHGVGFLLNVHEGPNSFSYRQVSGRSLPCVFEEGMVTSDEPGYYEEDAFGVRCENLILCVKDEKTEYGQFLRFETLTMVPWDLDAVLPEEMTQEERKLLNEYHEQVYNTLAPLLNGEEREWLKKATRAV